ncbi:hypothetical protein PanWU01x14_193220, partial [Parasponia andersonii]
MGDINRSFRDLRKGLENVLGGSWQLLSWTNGDKEYHVKKFSSNQREFFFLISSFYD